MGVFMIRLSLKVFTYHLPLIKCVKGAKLELQMMEMDYTPFSRTTIQANTCM